MVLKHEFCIRRGLQLRCLGGGFWFVEAFGMGSLRMMELGERASEGGDESERWS